MRQFNRGIRSVLARSAKEKARRRGDDPAAFRRDLGQYTNVPLLSIMECDDPRHLDCLRRTVIRSGVHNLITTASQRRKSHPQKINFRKVAIRLTALGREAITPEGYSVLLCRPIKVSNGKHGHRGVMAAVIGIITGGEPPQVIGYFFGLKELVRQVGLAAQDPE